LTPSVSIGGVWRTSISSAIASANSGPSNWPASMSARRRSAMVSALLMA
jgi:hypothetical protein